MGNLDVDAGHVVFSAADSPRHDSGQLPNAADLANEGSASVSFAGVFALFATGANEPFVQLERLAQFGPLQHPLAQRVGQHGHLDLLQSVLIIALDEGVLAPPGDEAPPAGEVVPAIRQTDRANVRVRGVVHVAGQADEGDVVVEVAGVKLVVHEHVPGVVLDVGVEFGVVVDVPFADADSQLFRFVVLNAMGRGQDMRAVDEGPAAEIHVVELLLLQDGHLPRIFGCKKGVKIIINPVTLNEWNPIPKSALSVVNGSL